jgi:hypothetical protein
MLKLGDLLNLVKYPSHKSINLYGDRHTFIVDRSQQKHRLNILLRKFLM